MTQYPYGSDTASGGLGPMPGDNDTRQAAVTAPADVDKAFKLWLVNIGIAVLGIIASIALADRDEMIDTAMQNSSELTRDQANTGVTIGLVGVAVFVLIILGLELFFAFKMRSGRNWARIVLTVVGAVYVLFGMFGLTGGFTIATLLPLISLIVLIAAIVFMFRPAANEYFSQPTH